LVYYDLAVDYVTRLPSNDIGEACIGFLRQHGVGVDKILRGGERLGIYFLEMGSMQRGSKVVYDRALSAIAIIEPGMLDWGTIFADADWFHWTGIAPAISAGCAYVCLEALKTAKVMGLTISCDLNYRKNLWKWGKQPGEVMPELVAYCDIAIGNEEDADKVFGIKAPESEVTSGKVAADQYRYVCEGLAKRFSGLRIIAITLRGSISASHNTWSGVLWTRPDQDCKDDSHFYIGPIFNMIDIVDRVGGGDSFVGGLIYGLRI
jgi:2-dehydro-3-deoxygluconokinase